MSKCNEDSDVPQSPYHDDRLDECPCLSIPVNRAFTIWIEPMADISREAAEVGLLSGVWTMMDEIDSLMDYYHQEPWRGLATLKPDLADYVWRDLGDGQPVRVKRCQMCGVAPSAVDDCGMPSPACPYFGRNNSKHTERAEKPTDVPQSEDLTIAYMVGVEAGRKAALAPLNKSTELKSRMNLNKIQLAGRLTRAPELKSTNQGTSVCSIGLAVNRRYKSGDEWKEEVVFVDVTFWGRTAENVGKYFDKGSRIYLEGRLRLEQWEDRESGQKRSKLSVVGENFEFLDTKGGTSNQTGGQASPAPVKANDDEESDDIPF